MPGSDTPRRYISNVLIGLTSEETQEFEGVDEIVTHDASRTQFAGTVDEAPSSTTEHRWLELYKKHENAWMAWKIMNATGSKTINSTAGAVSSRYISSRDHF